MPDITAHLPIIQADYTAGLLDISPQKTMVVEGDKNQVVHTFDDMSVAVVTLSGSFFVVSIQWPVLSTADAQDIHDLYHDEVKANARARTFYFQHPLLSDVVLVCRFMSPLPGMYTAGRPNSESINSIDLRIEGVAPFWYDYLLYMSGITDLLSETDVVDTSAGSITYINDSGELVTVPAGQPLVLPGKGFTALPALENMINNGLDPSQWVLNALTRTLSGDLFGSLPGYALADTGATWNQAKFYRSSADGNPTGIQRFCIIYKIGSSGAAYLNLADEGTGTFSTAINSTGTWVVGSENAGSLSITEIGIADDIKIILFSIAWNNPANSLYAAIGPLSNNNSDIILFAAPYIIDSTPHVWPVCAASATAVVTRAGTTGLSIASDGAVKVLCSFRGIVSGVELYPDGVFDTDLDDYATANSATISISAGSFRIENADAAYGKASLTAGKGVPTEIGGLYKLAYGRVGGTGSGVIHVGSTPNDSNILSNQTATVLYFTAISTETFVTFNVGGNTLGHYYVFDNVSIQKILPASFLKTTDFTTPSDTFTDMPNDTIINIEAVNGSAQDQLYLWKDTAGDGWLCMHDGTNTAKVAMEWSPSTKYYARQIVGYNISEASRKMRIDVSTGISGPWTEGSLSDVVDHFPVSSAEKLIKGYDTSYMISSGIDVGTIRKVENISGWRTAA